MLDTNVHIGKCGFVGLMYKLVTIRWNHFKPLSDIGNMVGSTIHNLGFILVATPITKFYESDFQVTFDHIMFQISGI
jgi:hypothetical protein